MTAPEGDARRFRVGGFGGFSIAAVDSLCASLGIAGCHTRPIDLMHRVAPVREVRPELVETIEAEGLFYDTVKGISAILTSAVTERKQLSEIQSLAVP